MFLPVLQLFVRQRQHNQNEAYISFKYNKHNVLRIFTGIVFLFLQYLLSRLIINYTLKFMYAVLTIS